MISKFKAVSLLVLFTLFAMLNGCKDVVEVDTDPTLAEEESVSRASRDGRDFYDVPFETLSGKYSYSWNGGSLSPNETACEYSQRGTINVQVPNGANVVKAYIFWSTSSWNPSRADKDIKLDGINIRAHRSYGTSVNSAMHYNNNYADVTNMVRSKGGGNYTFSDLYLNNTGSICRSYGTLAVASILVVYEEDDLPMSDLHLYFPKLTSLYPSAIGDDINQDLKIPDFDIDCPEDCDGDPLCKLKLKITCCWIEGDGYKGEKLWCWSKDISNTLDGSEAPNLDIDSYEFNDVPSNGILPMKFVPERCPGTIGCYEGAGMCGCVIKVYKEGSEGVVRGCLVRKNGKPIADAKIRLRNRDTGERINIKTDANGKFCQELEPGSYIFRLRGEEYELVDGNRIPFEVDACKEVSLGEIVAKPA